MSAHIEVQSVVTHRCGDPCKDVGVLVFEVSAPSSDLVTFKLSREEAFQLAAEVINKASRLPRD